MLPNLREIVRQHGGDVYAGGNRALVPAPGHSRKDRGLSLRLVEGGRVIWAAFNDTTLRDADVRAYLGLEPGEVRQETPAERRARQEAERRERARKLAFCADVWKATEPAEGSPVARYLESRAILGPIPRALRFHPAAPLGYPWNAKDGAPPATLPAMVAIATAEDGKSAAGLHCTFLAPDGSGKARLGNPRRMFGDLGGGVVQLAPLPVGGALAVAEGVETALAYRDLKGVPCWAALSTAGLRRFTVPRGPARLVIAADSDDGGEGLKAAHACAERATSRCAATIDPAPEGQDWNDALRGEMVR